ncbi:MAG: DUF6531 domain-containing protein, partial [Verrucomicrobia bacterium]|nr:DUF6531 domain-containing protein [Verrucomicrobiota bacterium]
MNSDGHRFLKPGGARRPASRASISRACLLLAGFWLLTSAAPAAIFTNNARIEIPDSTGSLSRSAANGDLTVMCWFKFSIPSGVTINNDMTILVNQSGSTTTNNTHAYNLYFNAETGAVEFTAKGAAGLYRQTLISRPFIDRWYHVAVAMSGGSYYAYVDGQTVTTPGTGASGDSSVTNGITIGGWGSGKYLWGEVQEVAIYKYYLQATDVRAYMFGDQRSNPEIQGYYKLGASTNSADWLKNFVAGAAAGSGNAFPSIDNLAFEETDQAGEQSLYDSRKNGGSDAITPLSGAFSWSQTAFARPTPGIAFQFAYGYSSALPPDGGSGDAYDKRSIGRGWRHTFDVRLVRGEKTTVLNLITWDGATEVWDRSPTNASIYFTRHKEYRGELIRLNNLDDDYEWTTSDRLVYRFRSPEYGNENLNGRLLEIRDFNTNRVTISGNSLGLVTNVTDSAAGNYTFIYSSQLLTNVTFGNWSLNFNYDFANRRLISKSITNTSGLYTAVSTTWQFQYANPSNGPLVRIIDPRGFTNTFVQYDQYGRKTNEVDALNRATATRYGVPGKRQITRVDPGTNSWIETYDRKGRITAQQDPLTNITSYTNDDRGNRTSITEPLGWKTCFGYDSRANVIARTNELGEITRWAFHGFFNKATNEVDALGWTNHYVLDNNTGNLLRHFDDRGTLVSYTYRTNGLVETTTDANGNTSRFAYDTNGFLVAQTDPATNTNSFAVNEVGWKLAHTNALGKVTTFAYDLNGNVLRTVDPIQRVFTKTYDANGNLLAASDAKNQFTFSFYDAANQRTQTVDRAGATNRFFYTTRGKLDRATDALGNTTTNSYDSANRLIAASDPLGQSVTNVFDANGNVVTMIDKLGQSWSKTY